MKRIIFCLLMSVFLFSTSSGLYAQSYTSMDDVQRAIQNLTSKYGEASINDFNDAFLLQLVDAIRFIDKSISSDYRFRETSRGRWVSRTVDGVYLLSDDLDTVIAGFIELQKVDLGIYIYTFNLFQYLGEFVNIFDVHRFKHSAYSTIFYVKARIDGEKLILGFVGRREDIKYLDTH